MVRISFKRAERPLENRSDTWIAGRWDDCRAGQTCRTDAARHRAADSSGNPKTKAPLPISALVPVKHRARPTCRQPRPIRIDGATLSASSSRPRPWTIRDSSDDLKPTMAGHSPGSVTAVGNGWRGGMILMVAGLSKDVVSETVWGVMMGLRMYSFIDVMVDCMNSTKERWRRSRHRRRYATLNGASFTSRFLHEV